MIEIRNVTFIYKDETIKEKVAIKNFSLEIPSPSFWAIVGANGSGKSTLARLMNGLLIPTYGDIIVDGVNTKEENRIWEIRQKVGLVFQNPDNQIIGMTVEEDVAFGCENLGLSPEEIEERVNFALTSVGMNEYRNYPPHLLSGGQKQRVAIAGILAMLPKYIILDEPTTMLDLKGRKEILNIIKQLYEKEKISIILITHNMEEVILAEKVIILDNGEIKFIGTPREVFSLNSEIFQWGLDLPLVTKLSKVLKNKGLDIYYPILTVEELKECL